MNALPMSGSGWSRTLYRMNIPHLHLILTHAPIFMVIIGVAVLIAALLRHSADLRWTAYALFVLGALVAIPVFLSGEGSEEAIEHVAGVSEAVIEAHAAAAKVSLIGIEILGLASLVAFALERMRRELIAPVMGLLVVLGSLTSASLAYTANLGGQIRHSEIRNGAAVVNGGSAGGGSERSETGESAEK
jgi:uncharacterized membrane protein